MADVAATSTDREQVYDLMIRYGRCIDAKELDRDELFRACYTEDATIQYDAWDGPGTPLVGLEGFKRYWGDSPLPFEGFHQFTNFSFEIDGDEGAYKCLGVAYHWPRGARFPGDAPVAMVGVRYENRVRRTERGWRIAEQRNIPVWTSGDQSIFGQFGADEAQDPATGPRGQSQGTDRG